jgi:cytolysin (calcineurin-like family phosphatase)
MDNCKSVGTVLKNIAALNVTGAIDKAQWAKV